MIYWPGSGLDPWSSYFVDPDTINPDPVHWYFVDIATVPRAGARLQPAGLSPLRGGGRQEVQLPDQVRERKKERKKHTQTDRESMSPLRDEQAILVHNILKERR